MIGEGDRGRNLKLRIIRSTEKSNKFACFDDMIDSISFIHWCHLRPLLPCIRALMRPDYQLQ